MSDKAFKRRDYMNRIKKFNNSKWSTFLIPAIFATAFFLITQHSVSGQRTYRLYGIGRTAAGNPILRADVVATNKSTYKTVNGKTDNNGRYSIPGLLRGNYKVDFYVAGYPVKTEHMVIPPRVTHTTGAAIGSIIGIIIGGTAQIGSVITSDEEIDTELNFVFDEVDKIELQGTVKDSDNKSIPDVKFKITRLSSNVTEKVSLDSSGNYFINNLDSGDYQIELQAAGYQTITMKVSIINGKPKTKNFQMQKEK